MGSTIITQHAMFRSTKMQKARVNTNNSRDKKNAAICLFLAWYVCVDDSFLHVCMVRQLHLGLFLPTPCVPTPFVFLYGKGDKIGRLGHFIDAFPISGKHHD
jgi:hypothetical protein